MTAADLMKAMALVFGVACFFAVVIAVVLSWLTEEEHADRYEQEREASEAVKDVRRMRAGTCYGKELM